MIPNTGEMLVGAEMIVGRVGYTPPTGLSLPGPMLHGM
jgi:hypothetical protein